VVDYFEEGKQILEKSGVLRELQVRAQTGEFYLRGPGEVTRGQKITGAGIQVRGGLGGGAGYYRGNEVDVIAEPGKLGAEISVRSADKPVVFKKPARGAWPKKTIAKTAEKKLRTSPGSFVWYEGMGGEEIERIK